MKFLSSLLQKASGSVGGSTYSRNRGGQYIRARTTPTNPSSAPQQAQRALLSSLVAAWGALTTSQRDAWNAYAVANPITDKLGEPRNAGGLGLFIKAQSARRLFGLTNVVAAPTISTPVVFTPPVVTAIIPATPAMTLTFTNTDEWATAAGGAMGMFVSRPQPATINGFKGPFLFAGRVLGAATPPTSPINQTIPFPIVVGQRLFVRTLAVSVDGRVSGESITFRVA